MSKKDGRTKPTAQQLKLVRRAIREKLGIDTGLSKKKKKKDPLDELGDPDEELRAQGEVKRKNYA